MRFGRGSAGYGVIEPRDRVQRLGRVMFRVLARTPRCMTRQLTLGG